LTKVDLILNGLDLQRRTKHNRVSSQLAHIKYQQRS
jgi:hypothetical protein